MPDDHSDVVPLLPIPNRKVKRVCADDSADTRVKVGHRQAITAREHPVNRRGAFFRAACSLKKSKKFFAEFDRALKSVS